LATETHKKTSKRLTKAERERKAAEMDTRIVWGNFTIQKDRLIVTAKQSWQTVQFVLKIVAQHNTPHTEHLYIPGNQHINQNYKNTNAAPNAKSISPEDVPRPSVATEEDEYVSDKSIYQISPHGRFGILQLEQHRCSVSGNFDDQNISFYGEDNRDHVVRYSDVVNLGVEVNQVFRFVQDSRF